MNILITGVTGFIGKFLASQLLREGHDVYGLDNFYNSSIEDLIPGVNFHKCDISNESWIDYFSNCNIDCIIHLAAQSSGEVSFLDPIYDVNTNVVGTINVAEYARINKVDRVIFASSMSVYGETQGLVSEEMQTTPISFYAAGKKSSEDYLRIFAKQYDINIACLRFFNVYGEGQNLKNLNQGMVSIFLAQLIENEEIIVKGGMNRFRDFIYISDLSDILKSFIMTELTKPFDIINVGTGSKTTVKDLILQLQDIFGTNKPVIEQGGTVGDQKGIYCDNSKLLEIFPINFITVKEGLKIWEKILNE